ncbi:TolC family protein [Massilia aerilata]|uniref:TolC family protein n=1 Tax=Massilia aerilata TaxID=453817 RepID=A0ABW0RYH7_9BURK
MNTPKRRPAMLAAVFLLAWGSCAAEPIDLTDAIRLALAQPALRAAAHEAAASEAAIGQAGSYPNPELAWLREGQQRDTRTTTVQINQTIELGGKRQARAALAQEAAGLAHSELAARRQEVRAEVIAGWYAVLIAQRRLQLAQAMGELARRSVEVAGKRVRAGKISPIAETRARLAAVDAAAESNQAGAELAVARHRLGALTGMPAGTLVLDGQADRLPDLEPAGVLLARARASASVRRARSQLALQEAQAGVERAARLPDLTLSVGSQREGDAGRRQAVVGLSLPLPLFKRNESKLRAALRRTDKARDELAAAETNTAAELASARTRYDAAREEARLLQRDVLPDAQSAYELTLKGFEYGKFSILDVLDAQRTWFQAQSRASDSMLAAYRAYADIERIAGPTASTD